MRRVDLIAPDPSPRKRWSKTAIDLSRFGVLGPFSDSVPLDVAVSSRSDYLRMKYASNTLYAAEGNLPRRSFIEIEPGLAMSCPELLFAEMATIMDLPDLLMLGYELCGGFSRDAIDPLNGPITLNRDPVTSCAKLRTFLQKTKWLEGTSNARRALELLADNAWSSTESIVATIASLPFGEFGYELAPCVTNQRIYTPDSLKATTERGSRVPDILFGDSRVGINYDGAVHLDLDSIARAARDAQRYPETAAMEFELDRTIHEVRAKVVDDIRRNRELAAAGYVVFPVVKEDLYEEGSLDRVMMQVIEALERYANRDMSKHRRVMKNKFIAAKRQELIWSLLPGKHREFVSNRREAFPYLYQTHKVKEIMIGF